MICLNAMTWVSIIITACCVLWLLGLFVFALVVRIKNKSKMKQDLNDYEKRNKRKLGA